MNRIDAFNTTLIGDWSKYRFDKRIPAGYVYAVEFGPYTKVGATRDPHQRMDALRGVAKYAGYSLGGFCISPRHLGYVENEIALHSMLPNRKPSTELFYCDLKIAYLKMQELKFDVLTEDLYSKLQQEMQDAMQACEEAAVAYLSEKSVNIYDIVKQNVEVLGHLWESGASLAVSILEADIPEDQKMVLFMKAMEHTIKISDVRNSSYNGIVLSDLQ